MKYNFKKIESKWQQKWEDEKVFRAEDYSSKPKFYGLVERLRNSLNKKVDVLDINQLVNNKELLNEILKDGIKIYEDQKR